MEGDTSLGGYASTARLSTREPLRRGPSHVLLGPFNSLLNALGIPLSLSTLSLATPTLLLAVLEALLETRIADVPDDHRASWERSKRTKVAQIVVQAIGEVLDGLARSKGQDRDEDWRSEPIQIRSIVRGAEGELAKLVDALLKIAQGFGVPFDPSPTASSNDDRSLHASLDPAPLENFRQVHPVKLPTSCTVPSSDPAPPFLFAPRPLRQPLLKPPHSSQSLSPSISSSSSRSSSLSTSLTIPQLQHHRPSLVQELERSGTLSPPPKMPGSPRRPRISSDEEGRSRSRLNVATERVHGEQTRKKTTLELMRERQLNGVEAGNAEGETGGEPKFEDEEVEDVFSTPRNNALLEKEAAAVVPRQGKGKVRGLGKDGIDGLAKERRRIGLEEKEGEGRNGKRTEERVKSRKGKERAREQEEEERMSTCASAKEEACCGGCGTQLLPLEPKPTSGQHAAAKSDDSLPPALRRRESRRKRETDRKVRKVDSCRCCSTESEGADDSEREASSKEEEEADSNSSSTLGKTTRALPENKRRPTKRPKDPGKTKAPTLDLSASTSSSQAARRTRVYRVARVSSKEAGNLSVHGESEIERFEASRQSSSGPASDPDLVSRSPPTTPSTTQDPATSASTPSPYTMLLLAQRARLAEKLRALELRERDRIAARRATESTGSS